MSEKEFNEVKTIMLDVIKKLSDSDKAEDLALIPVYIDHLMTLDDCYSFN